MQAAYGDQGAWQITPVSFALPEELEEWRRWAARGHATGSAALSSVGGQAGGRAEALQEHQQAQRLSQQPEQEGRPGSCRLADDELWILKTGQDAGDPKSCVGWSDDAGRVSFASYLMGRKAKHHVWDMIRAKAQPFLLNASMPCAGCMRTAVCTTHAFYDELSAMH